MYFKREGRWYAHYIVEKIESALEIPVPDITLFHAGCDKVYCVSGGNTLYSGVFNKKRPKNITKIILDSPLAKNFKTIVSGYHNFLALTEEGHLFGGGYSQNGELGTGKSEDVKVGLIPFKYQEKDVLLSDVKCAVFHTIYLARDGRVFGSGRTVGKASGPNYTQMNYATTQFSPVLLDMHLDMHGVISIHTHYRSLLSFFVTETRIARFGEFNKHFFVNRRVNCPSLIFMEHPISYLLRLLTFSLVDANISLQHNYINFGSFSKTFFSEKSLPTQLSTLYKSFR